jgi:hypothetical protein
MRVLLIGAVLVLMVVGGALLFGDALTQYIGPPQPLEPASGRASTTGFRQIAPPERMPTLEDTEAMPYNEFTPYFRKLQNSKNVRGTELDTPSGWRSFMCVDVRQLKDPREKVAYLAMSKFTEEKLGSLLIPYVVSDTIPADLWDHAEIREVMAPILETAKKEYRELIAETSQ